MSHTHHQDGHKHINKDFKNEQKKLTILELLLFCAGEKVQGLGH